MSAKTKQAPISKFFHKVQSRHVECPAPKDTAEAQSSPLLLPRSGSLIDLTGTDDNHHFSKRKNDSEKDYSTDVSAPVSSDQEGTQCQSAIIDYEGNHDHSSVTWNPEQNLLAPQEPSPEQTLSPEGRNLNDSSEETSSTNPSNPFIQFACQSSSPAKKQKNLSEWIKTPIDVNDEKPKHKTTQSDGTTWIKMQNLPVEEQERIINKLHSLVDAEAPLEDRRFQLLVAARLHTQCLEKPVRQAMKNLRQFCANKETFLTVHSLAKATVDDIKPVISNLNYYSTKAKHIIMEAKQLLTNFNGRVPDEEFELQKLIGIGPVTADLLAFVNTKAQHQKFQASQTEVTL